MEKFQNQVEQLATDVLKDTSFTKSKAHISANDGVPRAWPERKSATDSLILKIISMKHSFQSLVDMVESAIANLEGGLGTG